MRWQHEIATCLVMYFFVGKREQSKLTLGSLYLLFYTEENVNLKKV